MRIITRPLHIIRANLRAYLAVNAFVYGLILIGMAVATIFPEINASRTKAVAEAGSLADIAPLLDSVWLLAGRIFLNNVVVASLLVILLPSLIIPFAGLILFAMSLVDTGFLLAPVNDAAALILLPHSITLLIEMQAYVVLLFGVFLLGRAWLRPAAVGKLNRRSGYLHGLQQLGWLALPVLALHAVGSIYEAYEVIHLIPVVLGN
ncbi:stage II sporulation protein M [Cryobacterium lactosi]|uniref:Stage II sporulation protein M n=1 Tax=Cryobacterium lactosi TaxID=1259202 RepID=A0A4R9BPT9_9MICO|nr:stage II sporulation protein M [Cryobacterium lactosi]TFD88088.1 stage II sporulation protein M [Cryobacterium lactosi]